MDRNLYFDTRVGKNPALMKFGADSLNEWKRRGHDLHSQIADPLFVAPDVDDFRLQRQSPALKAGFNPIDLRDLWLKEEVRGNILETTDPDILLG